MKKDSKQRLFEVMSKLDSSFNINESENPCWDGYKQLGMKEKNGKEVPNCVSIDENDDVVPDDASSDVKMAYNLKTPAQKSAYNKINYRDEFKDAFKVWFSDLGVANKYKYRINITTTLNDIRDVLKEFGVKD